MRAFTWLAIALLGCAKGNPVRGTDSPGTEGMASDAVVNADSGTSPGGVSLRVASFNGSLYRSAAGDLARELRDPESEGPRRIAEVVQRVRPDILLLNEFDFDADGESARLFQENFLARSQESAEPIEYAHRLVPETNTGEHSGFDLDNDGATVARAGSRKYGGDAFGFGAFPGQYGMVVYSRFPIVRDEVRSFRKLLWRSLPDAQLPSSWFDEKELAVVRLSSKNHVDVPIDVGGTWVHLLASHPTPPAFDGPEDRNGRRNHDELRLWLDYIDAAAPDYMVDDDGRAGGLAGDAFFVMVGDLNADPNDGDELGRSAMRRLLAHPRVTDPRPTSEGARTAAERSGGANAGHRGDPALDTADFDDESLGNLRLDYALPSSNFRVERSGVFWPPPGDPLERLADASDHHCVWVDLTIGPR